MFRGLNTINLDAKGRLAIPAKYRERLAELCAGRLVVTIDTEEKSLLIYPLNEWETIEKQITALPSFDKRARRIQRLILGHASDVELDGSGRILLRAKLPTMASLLAKAGYRTGLFGKWHLGDTYPYRPEDRGFQETVWFPSSHINSTPDHWNNDYFDDTFRHNGGLKKYQGYCTDVFFTEAIKWIKAVQTKNQEQGAKNPFYLYLPTNTPHWPHWVPQKHRDAMSRDYEQAEAAGKLPKLPERKRASLISYLAMIRNIDDNFGRLDKFLNEAGLAENTIVIFLNDNGSTFGPDYFNAGMRGRKTQLWEGGHRVSCFIRWPDGNIGKPRNISGLTQVQDLLPTVLDLCEVKTDARFNGASLKPVFEGEAAISNDRMLVINYSRMPHGFEFAAPDSPSIMRREGAGVLWQSWRLLEDRLLYNLAGDPLQRTNVFDRHPQVVARMRSHLDTWWSDVKDVANEPQPVVIGHPKQDPVMLTACEWLDVFIDQQLQTRRADLKNGWWELQVARGGHYEFELRRWPREANLPLTAGAPAVKTTDGEFIEGKALPIANARIRLGTRPGQSCRVRPDDKHVTFKVWLPEGRTRLYTWFEDAKRQSLLGAYHVYVRKL